MPIIVYNCFIIVSVSDIPTNDWISTKNTSIDNFWWELSTDVPFDHSRSSVRTHNQKNIIGKIMIIDNYFANGQSNLADLQLSTNNCDSTKLDYIFDLIVAKKQL
jgi:hypothetical protein